MAAHKQYPAGLARAEWAVHWPLVLVSVLGFSLLSVGNISFGAFIAPLETAFGWTRAEATGGLMVYSAVCVVCQPMVGRLIDRWGPRKIALIGTVLSAAGFALFGATTGSLIVWLLLWFVYTLATQLILTPVWSAAVASEFDAGRGLALAVTISGSAISTTLAPIVATRLIEAYDWRTAYIVMGILWGTIVLIPAIFLFHSRLDRLRAGRCAVAEGEIDGISAREGLRSPSFYKLLFGTTINYTLVIGIMVHMIPITTGSGLSRDVAALVAASLGVTSILGKLICGMLVNRLPGHVIIATALALPVVACLMLMTPTDSIALRLVAATFLGVSAGGHLKMLIYLATRHFGMRAFGTLFGFISSGLTLATGAGPFICSYLFDLTGNYQLVLTLAIPTSLIGSLLMLWVGPYPEDRREDATRAAAAGTQPAARG
jgi:MFS family permease